MNIIGPSYSYSVPYYYSKLRISTDDGVNFSSSASTYPPYSDWDLYGFYLHSEEQIACISGIFGHIYKTVNQGASWTKVYDGTYPTYRTCKCPTNESIIWMLTRNGKIIKSTDTGDSWSLVCNDYNWADYAWGIHFVDENTGWLVGNKRIYKSTNGGTSWSEQKNFAVEMSDVFAVDSSTVWALEYLASDKIWKSTDGGVNWTGYTTTRTKNGGRIFAIGNDNVWFTGKLGTALECTYSPDGGANWATVAITDSFQGNTQTRVPIKMLSTSVGFIANVKCFKTIDGGQTWSALGTFTASTAYDSIRDFEIHPYILSQFRTFDITGTEPANRTTAGSAISQANPLNFGEMPKGYDSNVKVAIWRVTNLGAYTVISNMRFWLYDASAFVGANDYHADITNTWTQNKTPAQVKAGTPGVCPQAEPTANLTKIGGGDITGIGHADTSQYIYLVNYIETDESDGTKNFSYRVKFDYA